MKNINRISIIAGIILLLASGCKLHVQEDFVFNPEIQPLVTFKDQTVWEWLQTNPGGEFVYMVQAITQADMINEYNANPGPRTFLLLKDIAFTASNGVLQVVTGSRTGSLANLTAVQKMKLKNLLLYHILDEYIDQGPEKLYILFQDYFFQTLLPGDAGRMSIRRDERFRMNFNYSNTFPSTKRQTNSMLHNYIFKNGIAHLSTTYLRITPF